MSDFQKKVGNYKLLRSIGYGATSQVFEAIKEGDHEKYAIKMIRLKSITEGQRQMISKQVSIIKNISHPNIVKLHNTLQTTNNYYLIFEFCQKGDLQKYLKQCYGPLIPEHAVQRIVYCIGDAIREIHSKGIVHRDLKLANILLKRDLTIKLADFGFAKEVNSQQMMMKTYCGTPITMAPEILLNKYYDRKCDIWSLGIIMFQLVYGNLPFSINQGYSKFVERVINQQVIIPTQPQMPQQFKDLLLNCLQKDPIKRCSIQVFMCNQWVLNGKDKKLQQRKNQVQQQNMSVMLKNMEYSQQKQLSQDGVQKQIVKQNNIVIEKNTAEKLYQFIRQQIDKILEDQFETRNEIYNYLILELSKQSLQNREGYEAIFKLLYYLDYRYLSILKQLNIKVLKQNSEINIKVSEIKTLVFPQYLFETNKIPNGLLIDVKFKQKISPSDEILKFLYSNNLTDSMSTESLEKKKQKYQIVQKLLNMLRNFELNLTILFGHHFYNQQISMDNVYQQFKIIGKSTQSQLIKQSGQPLSSELDSQRKQGISEEQLDEQNQTNYDKNTNFLTISIEYKEKNPSLKEYRQNMKNSCQKMSDEISKTIQGYYN